MNKSQHNIFRLIAASCIGSTLEFYDFAVYAFFSNEIGIAFFPSNSHINSLIATFGVFAAGYLARPIGGIIFSHLGDKFGRKNNFAASIFLMAGSTFLMGLVPTYATIGAAGSYIFIGLRLLQGLSIGAETPGALTYISESLPDRQGLWCSVVFAFMNLGAVLAMLCHGAVSHVLNTEQFTQWGWRFPFLLGGVLGIFGYLIRKNMNESHAFKNQQWKAQVPLLALLQLYPLRLVAAVLIACLAGTTVALLYLYMPAYMQTVLQYHPNIVNLNGIYGLILYTLMIGVFGYFSDKFSRRKIIACATLIIALMAYPSYYVLNLKINLFIPFIFTIFAVVTAMLLGSLPSLFTKLFVTQVRYTGVAMSYNIGVGISAGLAPLIVTIFLKYMRTDLAPALLLVLACVIAAVGIMLVPKKLGLNDS